MSREQRRVDRRNTRPGAAPAKRTPVKAPGGGGFPWLPVGIAGGTLAVVLLIAYLIFQSVSDSGGLSASDRAELDDSPSLPGAYFPSQGRSHFPHQFSQGQTPTPFCDGVEHAEGADPETEGSSEETATGVAGDTPAADGTADTTPEVPEGCYSTNPPSSGDHLGTAANIEIAEGIILPRIPPDPNIYPPDVIIPREAIPHILEHAGVFVGYHCVDGDQACQDVVAELEDLVNDRIENHNDRVVMANAPDLPEGTIGLSGWTRVLNMPYAEYDEDAVEDFIGTHSCRYDPEGFC